MMNQEIKQKWIEALRSGSYSQTKQQLKKENSFCCLGVLCDLYLKENNQDWVTQGNDTGAIVHDEEEYCMPLIEVTVLPEKVYTWAGLDEENPEVEYAEQIMPISDVNDLGRSFKEIASIIEHQL
jgi:hypothetical protein